MRFSHTSGPVCFIQEENDLRSFERSELERNYRLPRARRSIENAIGILSAKWRIFHRLIKGNVDLVKLIVAPTVCLHNYVRLTGNATYIPAGFEDSEDISGNIVPGNWKHEVHNEEAGQRIVRHIGGTDILKMLALEGKTLWSTSIAPKARCLDNGSM